MFRAESRAAARTTADDEARALRRSRTLSGALLSACAGVVALWPFTTVVEAGPWSFTSTAVILVIVVTGMLVRLMRSGRYADGLWPAVAQIIVAGMALTLLLLPQGALLGVIPTGTTLTDLGRLAADAVEQVQFGTAPLADTPALRTMLAIGFAIIAVLLDQLIAVRLTLLAVILVASVGALPMIITLGDANVPWFVLLALLALFLLRHSIRHGERGPRRASTGVSIGVGAAAVAIALVVTPVLPISATWMGTGTSTQLDPSLRLGDDLRRPTPFTVMTLATTASAAPYLRVASLSEFDGTTWSADESDLQPVSDGFGPADWTDEIESDERRTSIRINAISGSWLPVPYAATKIVGTTPGWQIMPLNRTVTSEDHDAAGEDYTVTSVVTKPTREQIQAAQVTPGTAADVPDVVAETARMVTADAATDYDRLIAMQNWFRSEFEYSLDAPVDGDFDGTGADAVEEFLRVRSGYCIHFSGAFALMAQSLDMQVRIVVGYLPGSLSDEKRGDDAIYTVSSDQLHAWPEVHFDGIGWVPFEPTASLGTPTDFLPETTDGDTATDSDAPEATTAPSPTPTRDPAAEEQPDDTSATGTDPLRRLDPTPVVLTGAGILLVLLLPMLVRSVIRARRMGRARRGDAVAAWRELRAVLVDLRLEPSDADTPRMRGARLVERGADEGDVGALVDAVERASFSRTADGREDLADAVARTGRALRRSVDARDRVVARLLPRSLVTADPSRSPVLR